MNARDTRMRAAFTLTVAIIAAPSRGALAQTEPIREDVEYLAHDDRGGRVSGTAGWWAAHDYIHDRLLAANIPHSNLLGEGIARRHPDLPEPTQTTYSLLARIDGTDPALRNEYVLIGAHFDHVALGSRCQPKPGAAPDSICNGATDNAAGVGVVLEIARRLAAGPAPARSVVFAFWDREELDLAGSATFRETALPPAWPQHLTTYINYDIQGATLLDALASTTFAIAASSGGKTLQDAVQAAARSAPALTMRQLGEVLGMYRSDYANFVSPATVNLHLGFPAATLPRIPTVFFTDSNGPCYHTPGDEIGVVNWAKLAEQAAVGTSLVRDLANRSAAAMPTLVPYDDALNAKFDENLRKVAEVLAMFAPEIGEQIPGPVPPPTAADAQQLLEVARAAYGDPAVGAGDKDLIREQIANLEMGLAGTAGEHSIYSLLKWPRAAGPYRPAEDGVFVALAAVLAQNVIMNLPCR